MGWVVDVAEKVKVKSPVLVEGLPGIGNVGKIAVDFIIELVKAKKICSFYSNSLPPSVFVNEDNLVELPLIDIYYKKGKFHDILFLTGDIQPITEESCYSFSEKVLDVFQDLGGSDIVTLGGIGLKQNPKEPRLFCTGNSKDAVDRFVKDTKVSRNIHGIVGPIVGVSGVLVGLASRRKIPAVVLLAETYGHPLYLGTDSAREIMKVLRHKLQLDVSVQDFDREVKVLEDELNKKSQELQAIQNQLNLAKVKTGFGKDVNYIG
jgi:uncharacterized protein